VGMFSHSVCVSLSVSLSLSVFFSLLLWMFLLLSVCVYLCSCVSHWNSPLRVSKTLVKIKKRTDSHGDAAATPFGAVRDSMFPHHVRLVWHNEDRTVFG